MRAAVTVLALLLLAGCSSPPATAASPADRIAAGDFAVWGSKK